MAQVIAVTQIVRNIKPGVAADKAKGVKAQPPVSKTIEPGTLFVSEGEELATLRKARAVRDPEPGEFGSAAAKTEEAPKAAKAPAKAPAKSKGKAAAEGGDGTGGEGGSGDDDSGSNLV